MKAIFEYIDYRRFLRDYCEYRKRQNRHFSYRAFMAKTGINSPNFVQQVIAGKRSLTATACARFIRALQLPQNESTYFRHLVQFNQARTAAQKQEHYAVLVSLMRSVRAYRLTADQYAYFKHWYNAAIRELVCLHDFKDDFERLARSLMPPLTPRHAAQSVTLLLRLKLLNRRPDGTYVQQEPAVRSTLGLAPVSIRAFNKQMVELATQAIDTLPKSQRNISGMTVGISPQGYDVLVAEINAFKERIESIVNRDDKSQIVYQLNIQLFPLSREMGDDKRQGGTA